MLKSKVIFAFVLFFLNQAFSQTFVQMMGKDASLSYDGKVLTYTKGGEKKTWTWQTSSEIAEKLNIDAMIASAFMRTGGAVKFPSEVKSPEELAEAVRKAKDQALSSVNDPAAKQMIMQLESMLEMEQTKSRMCGLFVSQKPLTDDQRKVYDQLMKIITSPSNSGTGLVGSDSGLGGGLGKGVGGGTQATPAGR